MTLSLSPDDDRIPHLTFADWLSGVLRRWRVVMWCLVLAFSAGGLALLIIKPRYEAEASFMVNGAASRKEIPGASGLAGLAGQLGLGATGESSESPAFYKELLESRELLTRLLESRFPDPRSASPTDSARLIDLIGIRQYSPRERMERAVKKLRKRVTAETNIKTALIRVFVTTQWPELSAQVDNRAMELVDLFNRQQRVSRARAKRVYLHGRLDSALVELRAAEFRRREFLSGNRKMDFSPTLQSSDEQLKRNIDITRDDYQSLQKQVDAVRLDELNDAPLITIVDAAVPPAKPAWPKFAWLIVGCIIVGLILGVTVAGSLTVWDVWVAQHPASAARLSNAWHTMLRDITRRDRQRAAGA